MKEILINFIQKRGSGLIKLLRKGGTSLIKFIQKEGSGWVIFLGLPFALTGTLFNVIFLCKQEYVTYKLEAIVCSMVFSLLISLIAMAIGDDGKDDDKLNKNESTGLLLFAFGLFMCVMAGAAPFITHIMYVIAYFLTAIEG